MTETLLPIVQKINGYLSDYILVALLIVLLSLCRQSKKQGRRRNRQP